MSKKSNGRVLLGASYSVIEPLGLLHLAGVARDENWDRKIHLVKSHGVEEFKPDFEPFFEAVKEFKPNVVGFNVYTGNHVQLAEAYKRLKKNHPNIRTIVGGPHPTYFPIESSQFADDVVVSEGFDTFARILRGELSSGVHPMQRTMRFPHPDRKMFYDDYPEHAKSKLKSVITMTGCPYDCSYCYNSSGLEMILKNMPPEIAEKFKASMGVGTRLFPSNVRPTEDVEKEVAEVMENWAGDIYVQDDVFGMKFVPRINARYNAQMRFEMTVGDAGKKRLDECVETGCVSLTLAIEAANYPMRNEILGRSMREEIIFEGMKNIIERGIKVRTEQITALPYGLTSEETPINLDADLEIVELNVKLREEVGGPTMAWASTFAPYRKTVLGEFSYDFGFYSDLLNGDVPDSFFEKSVLRHLNQHLGSRIGKLYVETKKLEDTLKSPKVGKDIKDGLLPKYLELKRKLDEFTTELKSDDSLWLSPTEQIRYREQNRELRGIFNFVTLVPKGHVLARNYLESQEPFSYERLGRDTETHLRNLSGSNSEAAKMLENIQDMREFIPTLPTLNGFGNHLGELAPYFACLPYGKLAAKRTLEYALSKGKLTPKVLSDATRHHLYDKVLYAVGESESIINQRPHEIPTSRTSLLKV
ncbi:MAG: cobalamin-dependent protein [Nanoarchaeota archaeon]